MRKKNLFSKLARPLLPPCLAPFASNASHVVMYSPLSSLPSLLTYLLPSSIRSQADQLSLLNFNFEAYIKEASSYVHSSQGEVIKSDKVSSMDNDGNHSSSDSEDGTVDDIIDRLLAYADKPEDGDIPNNCFVDGSYRKRKMKDGEGKDETVDMGQEEKKEEEETAKDSEASQADANPLNSIHNGRGEGDEEEEGEEKRGKEERKKDADAEGREEGDGTTIEEVAECKEQGSGSGGVGQVVEEGQPENDT